MIYGRKWPEYADQWNRMEINASRRNEAERAAKYAVEHKNIYEQIEHETGVPWPMVAINHRRESDAQDKLGNPLFTSYLGNGQPLWIRTTIVPKGRGPFCDKGASYDTMVSAFVEGGKDAYHIDKIDQVKDWRLEKILYYSELFNGPGYDIRGLPSPYLWGGTNIQKKGKFITDGKFVPNALDKQLGCAPILWYIAKLSSLVYEREK